MGSILMQRVDHEAPDIGRVAAIAGNQVVIRLTGSAAQKASGLFDRSHALMHAGSVIASRQERKQE
ncbi:MULTISPECIES: hypothetical protein [unclassified Sphingobium]|uniref:hypothetical protein n=1 Tax=unclassified Sphingobium TaxID=2611147 RepID=UPI0015E6DB5B|nr:MULTISPECIES: hypothetical protein [unclassified Sphingobium]